MKTLTILNTNARSLCPKIESLVDCMDEMRSIISIITGTWLTEAPPPLKQDLAELEAGAGIGMLCLNRRPNAAGVSHGGVAIAFKSSECSLKEIKLENPANFEVLAAAGTLLGYTKKLVVIAAYLPPSYDVNRGRSEVQFLEDTVREMKRIYKDPFVVLGGDFNQWEIQEVVEDFPDMNESAVGPTWGTRRIDRVFNNFGRSEIEAGTVPPLEVEPGRPGVASDHRVAYIRAQLPRLRAFEWTTHQYRYYNPESVKQFGD